MAQIGRSAPPKKQPNTMELPNFLGAPIGVQETPDELFKRTGSPVADPANAAPAGQLPDFLGAPMAADEPEVKPYDWTVAGAPLPEALKPVGDILAGMNSTLASLGGVAVDDIDILMRNLGMNGIMDKPGEGKASVIAGMEKLGIGADKKKAVSQFLADIGEATGENLLMLSTFFAAAPAMMGAKGTGTLAKLQRQLGEALVKNPMLAVTSEATAAVGGETGAQVGSAIGGPTGEAVGGMAGAVAGGVIPALAKMTGIGAIAGGLRQGWGKVSEMVKAGQPGIGQTPLMTETTPLVDNISQAIRGGQMRVEAIIDKLSSKMTQSADPITASRQLQVMQRDAYKQARGMEGDYWSKVDMKRPVPSLGLKGWREGLINATVKEGRSEWLPNDLLSDIKGLPKTPSIERLRAIRTKAFHRIQSGTVPTQGGVLPLNDKMRGNLNGLIKSIDGEIDKAYPNDIELKKATSFSTWLHDRFTRGPVAQFSRPRAGETTLPPVRQGGRRALENESFGSQTADIADTLEMPAMKVAAEQFLRGRLNEEVTRIGPQAASKFLNQPMTKSFLKAYPQLAAEWESTASRLDKVMNFRKEVMNSAFIKQTNEQPAAAIRTLLTSKYRVRDARILMQRLKNDPDAIEAAKNQMILSMEEISGGNPTKLLQLLGSNDTNNAARAVLGSDLDRLTRIARHAQDLMQVDQGMPRYLLRRGGRVLGAYLGRKLNTGTLQAPEFGGKLVQKAVDDWLGRVEGNIFSNAIRYPAWEAILMSKAPQSLAELNHLKVLTRRAIRSQEMLERTSPIAQETLGLEDENEQ